VVVDVVTTEDVLALLDLDLTDAIILVHTAGATMLAPLFSELTGIICTTGGIGSHVAILAREFGVPCIVSAQIAEPIVGQRVRIESNGQVRLIAL
jgi:phosphohistidine swiveling domain-containing protein